MPSRLSFSELLLLSLIRANKDKSGMMGGSVAKGSAKMATPAAVAHVLAILKRHGVRELDTARVYNGGKSEELLGACGASADGFAISTKAPGFSPGSLSATKIAASCAASLTALRQPAVDIFYFHGPDRATPLEEQCGAVDALFRAGKFARFGVCNLPAHEVQAMHDICTSKGYVLPSVYQGGFNPVGRGVEDALFPTLRKLGMAFYGFSPLGGGYFSKPVAELRAPPKGTRMDEMSAFKDIYVSDAKIQLLEGLHEVCAEHGIAVKEATLRWFMHHSALEEQDGVILGASSAEQAEENCKACEGGRLPDDVVAKFAEMWPAVKDTAWPYHS